MQNEQQSVKKMIWLNFSFFAVTTLTALIGCPWYLAHASLSALDIGLFLAFYIATGLSITAGYHRLFAHTAYKGNAAVRFLFLFFGAAAFEQSAFRWASQHRDHHRYVDTDRDPYSIKKGFWYAHIGWMLFWKHPERFENVRDLQKDPMVMHQHRYYGLWAVTAGIVTPVAIGALFGHALSAFLFAVCLRLTLVYHATFCINSICHMFGRATYDIKATAKDHWVVALITFGEGYHNFHHKFPVDYRNGVRWYHWDPSKWVIFMLSWLGAARDLKRTSNFRILEARLAGQNMKARHSLANAGMPAVMARPMELLALQHARVRSTLSEWEEAVRHSRSLLKDQMAVHSQELREAAALKIEEARAGFKEAYERWLNLVEHHPHQLREVLLNGLAV